MRVQRNFGSSILMAMNTLFQNCEKDGRIDSQQDIHCYKRKEKMSRKPKPNPNPNPVENGRKVNITGRKSCRVHLYPSRTMK